MESRSLMWLSLVLAFIVVSYFIVQQGRLSTLTEKSIPIRVETALVKETLFAEHYATLGSLASTDSIDISSELAGQITGIYFTPGSFVEQGTLLIQLDDTVLKNELASAQANLTFSEANYKRMQILATRGLVSAQVLDKAFAEFSKKQTRVNVKQAQLQKLHLRAPFAGTVGSRQISIGQYVKSGQPLVHLVANHKLRVEYSLPERYLPRLRIGQTIHLSSDAYPQTIFHGQINYIAPAINKETRSIAVEALIDNPLSLLAAGLFVRVKHQFGDKKKQLVVPEESLIPTIHGQKIFVLHHNIASAVPVEIAAHRATVAIISKGLKAGDCIVVRGQHKLKEGSLVQRVQKK